MNKKTIFKVLAGVGAAAAGFGLFGLMSKGTNEEVVDDEYEYEEEDDVDEEAE